MRRFASPTLWFVLGFVLLQAAWVITLPPFRGSDEFDHVYRAAAVAGGEWVADHVPDEGRGLLVAVPPDIVEAAHAQCAALPYTGKDNCSAAGEAPGGKVYVASGAATYHPLYYWVVGTIGAPFTGTASLYVMRIVSALLCAVFVGLAAWSVTRSRGTWPLVGLVVALTPVLVYSTIVVAPNGLEMSAAVALWTSLLRLRSESDKRTSRRLLMIAIISATVMATLRWLGPLWIVMTVVAVAAYDPGGFRAVLRRHRRLAIYGAVAVGVSALNLVLWTVGPAAATPVPPEGATESLDPLYLLIWALQSIAAFPYRDQNGPAIAYGVVGALAIAVMFLGLRSSTRWRGVVILLACVTTLLMPLIPTLATIDSDGIIWQGRYGLPFGVGFVLLAATAIAERSTAPRLPALGAVAAGLALAVATSASLLKVRANELSDNAASTTGHAWHVPTPALLIVLSVAGMTSMLLAGRALGVAPNPEPATPAAVVG